jgi:hypothetical protein
MIYDKDYYEDLAITILEHYIPDKFYSMMKGECPDWYNDKIGLEVTRALSQNEGDFDGFIKESMHHYYSDLSQKRLVKLGFVEEPTSRDGILYEQYSKDNGKLYYIKEKSSGELLLKGTTGGFGLFTDCAKAVGYALETKLKKLRKYTPKAINDLAILVQDQLNTIVLQEEIVSEVAQAILDEAKRVYLEFSERRFDNIYVIFYDNIICIDTKTFEYQRIVIPNEEYPVLTANAKTRRQGN